MFEKSKASQRPDQTDLGKPVRWYSTDALKVLWAIRYPYGASNKEEKGCAAAGVKQMLIINKCGSLSTICILNPLSLTAVL